MTLSLWMATPVGASRPAVPLDPPLYSFDQSSPQVLDGTLRPGALLVLDDPNAVESIPPDNLGLRANDELNALAFNTPPQVLGGVFSLLFSVDRATVAGNPPIPVLVEQCIPYNVTDQAAKGHAAGDQFMSLLDFTRVGASVAGPGDNSQNRNNFNEGGSGFGGYPPVGSAEAALVAGQVQQDNVDATASDPSVSGGGTVLPAVYFAVGTGTAPILTPAELPSGANIYYRPAPNDVAETTRLFASAADLGLDPADDIDGLIVVDANGDGVFNGGDEVLISLTPESPSLANLGVPPDPASGADVFLLTAPLPVGVGVVQVVTLAQGSQIGLVGPSENIDALDILPHVGPCTDGIACALAHSIRCDDIPTLSEWGIATLAALVLAGGSAILRCRGRRKAAA